MEDYLKEMSDSSVPPGRVTVVRFCMTVDDFRVIEPYLRLRKQMAQDKGRKYKLSSKSGSMGTYIVC